jgi:hypothetical protein
VVQAESAAAAGWAAAAVVMPGFRTLLVLGRMHPSVALVAAQAESVAQVAPVEARPAQAVW